MHRDAVLYYICYLDLENIGASRRTLYSVHVIHVGVCVCIMECNFFLFLFCKVMKSNVYYK